jgi:molybdopterin synthase catalytic subunit
VNSNGVSDREDAGAGMENGSELRVPVAGVVLVVVGTEPLDLAAHETAVADRRSGAVVSFQGVVRDHDRGRAVSALEYEAHPSAADVLREVATEIAADPAVRAVAVSHRVGPLLIGDVALAAAVSTAHRAEAFAACARLVEEVKARLPVWKRQVFADGTEEWVNCP